MLVEFVFVRVLFNSNILFSINMIICYRNYHKGLMEVALRQYHYLCLWEERKNTVISCHIYGYFISMTVGLRSNIILFVYPCNVSYVTWAPQTVVQFWRWTLVQKMISCNHCLRNGRNRSVNAASPFKADIGKFNICHQAASCGELKVGYIIVLQILQLLCKQHLKPKRTPVFCASLYFICQVLESSHANLMYVL